MKRSTLLLGLSALLALAGSASSAPKSPIRDAEKLLPRAKAAVDEPAEEQKTHQEDAPSLLKRAEPKYARVHTFQWAFGTGPVHAHMHEGTQETIFFKHL